MLTELVAVLFLKLECIAAPDCVSKLVDELEDREGLLGGPRGGDLQRDGEPVDFVWRGHDLDLRR